MFCFIEPERIIIDCVLHLNIWNGYVYSNRVSIVHAFKKLRINLLYKKVHIKEVDLPMNKHFTAFTLIRSQSIFVPLFFLFPSYNVIRMVYYGDGSYLYCHIECTYIRRRSIIDVSETEFCEHWMNPHKENEIVNRCLLPLQKLYNTMQWTFRSP